MNSISVVILNYNKCEDLRRNLQSLRMQTLQPSEIIVVDNRSSDDSRTMVKRDFPEVNLVEMVYNTGVAAGRNAGYKLARGEFIVSLDDDAVCPPDTMKKTVELFHMHADTGCLAYLIRSMSTSDYDNAASSIVLANYHGAGHAFRRTALEAIGFLDDRYFFGAEEIDTSLRLLEVGYITRYVPEIVIDHYVRLHTGPERYRRMSLWIRNWAWFYGKYFPARDAAIFIARLLASFLFLTVRERTWAAFFVGVRLLLADLPAVVRARRVTAPEIVTFYKDIATQPVHFNIPITAKFARKRTSA